VLFAVGKLSYASYRCCPCVPRECFHEGYIMWGSIWRSEDRSTTMTRANEMTSQLFGTATKTVVLNVNYKIMRYVWCYTLYMSRDQHSSLFAMSNLRLRPPKKLKLSWRGYVRFCEHVGTCVMNESSIWTRLMKSCTMENPPVPQRFCSSNWASLEMRKNPKSQRQRVVLDIDKRTCTRQREF
jgi:hypothetical protein